MTEIGPESWKVKCGIRRAEDVVPMTDGGTLIMRNGPASTRRGPLQMTQYHHSPSIAPFAIDLEDYEEPARNSDAFGLLRRTTSIEHGRTTTNASFWSGLFAGLATLGVGAAIAFTAFTSDPSVSYGTATRDRHLVTRTTTTLDVEAVELAETKATAAPKKKHRVRHVTATTEEPLGAVVVPEPAPAPEPSENE